MKDKCFKLFWAYMNNQITKEEFYQELDKLENNNMDLFDIRKQ